MLVPWRLVTTPETVMEPEDGDLEGVFPFQNKWFSGLSAIQFVGELDFVAAVRHHEIHTWAIYLRVGCSFFFGRDEIPHSYIY